jgi:hypothetical protein
MIVSPLARGKKVSNGQIIEGLDLTGANLPPRVAPDDQPAIARDKYYSGRSPHRKFAKMAYNGGKRLRRGVIEGAL